MGRQRRLGRRPSEPRPPSGTAAPSGSSSPSGTSLRYWPASGVAASSSGTPCPICQYGMSRSPLVATLISQAIDTVPWNVQRPPSMPSRLSSSEDSEEPPPLVGSSEDSEGPPPLVSSSESDGPSPPPSPATTQDTETRWYYSPELWEDWENCLLVGSSMVVHSGETSSEESFGGWGTTPEEVD